MKFHKELNPKLWDKDDAGKYDLKPEVKEKLTEIAEAFITYLEIDQDAVKDVVITGSSASFNYTPLSDLDLHLRVDFDAIHKDCPVVEGYLGAAKSIFNKEHDITIYDVPVELYAEPLDRSTVHNGLYSLNTGWIDFPKEIPDTENDAAVLAKYEEIKETVNRSDSTEAAIELLDKVYAMRKAGLADGGEFSTENLTFKKLRDEGILQKLRDMKKEDTDKQLSLENFECVTSNFAKLNEMLCEAFEALDYGLEEIGKRFQDLEPSATWIFWPGSDEIEITFKGLALCFGINDDGYYVEKGNQDIKTFPQIDLTTDLANIKKCFSELLNEEELSDSQKRAAKQLKSQAAFNKQITRYNKLTRETGHLVDATIKDLENLRGQVHGNRFNSIDLEQQIPKALNQITAIIDKLDQYMD